MTTTGTRTRYNGDQHATNAVCEAVSAPSPAAMSMRRSVMAAAARWVESSESLAFTALSEQSFAEDWDNPDDAIYNDL